MKKQQQGFGKVKLVNTVADSSSNVPKMIEEITRGRQKATREVLVPVYAMQNSLMTSMDPDLCSIQETHTLAVAARNAAVQVLESLEGVDG